MSIYIDILFINNVICDLLVLSSAAELIGIKTRARIALAAVLGGAYAAAAFCLPELGAPASRLIAGCAVIMAAFGTKSVYETLRRGAIAAVCAACYAGVMYCAVRNVCVLRNAAVYTESPAWYISAFAAYILMKVLCLILKRRAALCTRSVRIAVGEKSVVINALEDSGNLLRCGQTPVVVAQWRAVESLFSCDTPDKLYDAASEYGVRLIPYAGVGGDGVMLAVNAVMETEGRKYKILLGVADKPLSCGGAYQCISPPIG